MGLVAAMLGAAAPAWRVSAQSGSDDARARGHFAAASSYFDEGDYEAALREFQRAYDLSRRAQLLYNIGLAFERLGRHAEAAAALQGYLDGVAEVENRAALERRIENLRRRAEQDATAASGTGTTSATGATTSATGATTSATGTTTGATGASTTASTSGTASTSATGTTTSATGATTGATGATTSDAGTTDGVATTTDASADAGPSGPTPVGAIASFAVGGAGLVLFGVGAGLAQGEYDAARSRCGVPSPTCTESDVAGVRTLSLLADVGLGVGVAGVALGAIFLATGIGEVGGESGEARARIAPWASPDGAGVTVGGAL